MQGRDLQVTLNAPLVGMMLAAVSGLQAADPLYLVKDGKALGTIVKAAPSAEKDFWHQPWYLSAGINDLRKYIKESSGGNLKIVTDGAEVKGPAIHVGRTAYVKSLGLPLDTIDKEGVILKRVGNNVVIVGGSPVGTRHAARIFLEDVCGVRW
ncbi:MAG: hypothetical protein QF473_05675, partial [Planctomycetota bacterium]|nr:hypothetical protein [Planctomycetota bacterium]